MTGHAAAQTDGIVRTEETEFRVAGVRRTHVWLEVLEGPDTGRRVSVPLYSQRQDEAITATLRTLDEGDVVSATLEGESDGNPHWIVRSLQIEYDQ